MKQLFVLMKRVVVFNVGLVGSEMVIRVMIWMNVKITVNWLGHVLLDSEIQHVD